MACRYISPSRRVRRTTIGCVRFFSAHCFQRRCYSQIVDSMRTGSGSLPASKERGQTLWRRKSVHKLLFSLMVLISVPPLRPAVHVLRRMTLAQTECTIFQRIHYDLGAPMKYPPHHGAEQNLAAAT
jgi:hypothetical protein